MKKTKEDVNKLKDSILEKASELFTRKNYSDITVKDLTEELGVSRTPLYYHFRNKQEIYIQVVDRILAEKVRRFREVLLSEEAFSDKIRKDLQECTRYALTERVLFSEIESNPDLAAVIPKRKAASDMIYDLKLSAIKQAQQTGELKANLASEELADDLYLLHYGIKAMMQGESRVFRKERVDRLIEIHIEDIRLRYGTPAGIAKP